jgi:hypothetical protein
VQVSAASLDAPDGGVQGQVVSGLVGVQRNVVDDQVQAHIARVDLKASEVQVYALNASSLVAGAKVASNQATGSTLALIADATLSAENDLHLLATDLARFEAHSAGFAANVSALAGVAVGNATASNTLERRLHAGLEGSSVEAGTLVVVAHSATTIAAKSEAMAVKGGALLAPDFSLTMGASQAWNQVLGDVQASIQRSSVVVLSLGGVTLSANNSSSVSAASVAGAAGSEALAFGASLAFNALGWRMGDIGAGALSSLLGADLNASEFPLDTLAFVSGSDIRSAAAVSVTAVNDITLEALMLSQAGDTSALGALSWGAAAVLTSNRVRSDTKAYIERASGRGSVVAGGSVTVSASDKAEILADVRLSATGAMAVGGVLVRNDVRGAVAADIEAASIAAAGDLQVLALESARIAAKLSGTVTTGASGFGASSMAANALIATNLVLTDAQAQVRDSTLAVDGSAEIAARNASTIAASNQAVTQGGGSAVGATLAFNTIGWQAQNVLSAGVDALLGSSLGAEQPASVRAGVLGGSLQAGGNISVTADANEQVLASIRNSAAASGSGTSASLVLASNLVSARAQASVGPMATAAAGSTLSWTAGGSVTISAVDRASIDADVQMASSSAGGMAVGAVVVRNDARTEVDAHAEQLSLSAGGELDVLALGAAQISAKVSGQVVSLGSDSALTQAGRSPSGSLAVNALIATNLVLSSSSASVKDSALVLGGDLTVAADDAASIDADNSATMSAKGVAMGLTLAFNTVGWQAQNLLFNAVDTLMGTGIGQEQAASVSATVVNTSLAVAGDVVVSAGGGVADSAAVSLAHGAQVSATLSNEVTSNAGGGAVSVLLASNLVSSKARAWVSPLADRAAAAAAGVGALKSLSVDGSMTVQAFDSAQIDADIEMSASSGGAAVGGVVVRNDVRSAVDAGLDRVAFNAGGDITVQALQDAGIHARLSGTAQTGAEKPAKDVGSFALDKSPPQLALNGLIANNLVLSTSVASLSHSQVQAAGSLSVKSENSSTIDAVNTATIASGGLAAGVTLAFNTIGWQPQNILGQTVDALLGVGLATEQPASAKASIEGSAVDVGGDLSVSAAVEAAVSASTSNQASSSGAGAAASLVLATNFVSSAADAFIVEPQASTRTVRAGGALTVTANDAPSVEAHTKLVASSVYEDAKAKLVAAVAEGKEYAQVDFRSEDGEQELRFGSQVLAADDHEAGGTGGTIYRYMGGTPTLLNLSEVDYTDAGYWYELAPAQGKDPEGLLKLVERARELTSNVIAPSPTEAWAAAEHLADAKAPQSESQLLTLGGEAQPGQVFSLALQSIQTAPIERLALGVRTDEVQRLTVLPGDQAAGQSYTLAMGEHSGSLVFDGNAQIDAARMQAAIEAWVGQGNVAVSHDSASRAGQSFRIAFQGAAAATNQAQVSASASGAAAGQLLFHSRTVVQGGTGATTADQAALIAAGLNEVLGAGAVNVVWQVNAQDQSRYRVDFTGAAVAGRDLAALRVIDKSAGLAATVSTAVQGALARGDSFISAGLRRGGHGLFRSRAHARRRGLPGRRDRGQRHRRRGGPGHRGRAVAGQRGTRRHRCRGFCHRHGASRRQQGLDHRIRWRDPGPCSDRFAHARSPGARARHHQPSALCQADHGRDGGRRGGGAQRCARPGPGLLAAHRCERRVSACRGQRPGSDRGQARQHRHRHRG